MPLFFLDHLPAIGQTASLKGREAKHISRVLRLNAGDRLVVTSGDGRTFQTEIVTSTPTTVTLRVLLEEKARPLGTPIALAQAIIKYDRTEWILQKGVELGIHRIIPFSSERTIPQCAERVGKEKHRRWSDIAQSAAVQSGFPFRPVVDTPTTLDRLTREIIPTFEKSLFFWESEKEDDLKSFFTTLHKQKENLSKGILIIIGPEGGFSPAEVQMAKNAGAVSLSLGPQILRVETAAITTSAICQYELGQLSLAHKGVT